MTSPRRIAFCVLSALLFSGVMLCQTQITGGVIQGTVLDPSGAVIPGAVVEAHNLDTNLRQSTKSDESGRFSFLALAAGNYEVSAKKDGFHAVRRGAFAIGRGSKQQSREFRPQLR
ncbi:MAG TPA: carboxypeptidase-like regulatory domain-containing protein, partial [Terriglobales bacterium]|nr:carboxypeptidase-like regulatory domain-containing protein [Terriglobales bacterium]